MSWLMPSAGARTAGSRCQVVIIACGAAGITPPIRSDKMKLQNWIEFAVTMGILFASAVFGGVP